ncbi:hypothetical protein [Serratia fonticola]|uniref:hypothetical protein n=1 Tax=Serratia fonticola TaxID=47917 RepID=UPI00301BB46A
MYDEPPARNLSSTRNIILGVLFGLFGAIITIFLPCIMRARISHQSFFSRQSALSLCGRFNGWAVKRHYAGWCIVA